MEKKAEGLGPKELCLKYFQMRVLANLNAILRLGRGSGRQKKSFSGQTEEIRKV